MDILVFNIYRFTGKFNFKCIIYDKTTKNK